jgi:hypothetical protein
MYSRFFGRRERDDDKSIRTRSIYTVNSDGKKGKQESPRPKMLAKIVYNRMLPTCNPDKKKKKKNK